MVLTGLTVCIAMAAASPPAGEGAMAPRLSAAQEGLILSWIEPGAAGHRLMWSRRTADGWSAAGEVTASDTMFANWADTPAVVEGGDGALYAHWLARSGEVGYHYDIRMLRSADGGESWDTLGKLNDDDVQAEHGFVSYAPVGAGVRAFWLDGRLTAGAEHGMGRMTLRTAIVGEEIEASTLVDSSVCDCCNTDAAMTSAGAIVVYRDRTDGERRDISIARADGTEGRATGRDVREDGWQIAACPVNGPACASEGGDLVVAWFTGAPAARVQVAFSDDGGRSFSWAHTLEQATDGALPLGRVDVLLDRAEAIVCWLRAEDGVGSLVAQRVGREGPVGAVVEIGPMGSGRNSGFAQMGRLGAEIVFTWRDGEVGTLRERVMPISSIGR